MQQMCRITGWHWKIGERYADHARFSDKYADVVQIGAIACQPARLQAPELRSRFGYRVLTFRDDENGISCR